MKRLRSAFYKELDDLRRQYGKKEYIRDQILPEVVALLIKHEASDDDIRRDAANAILDNAEKAEDDATPGLFDLQAQVALGGAGRPRIRRGYMNAEQLWRRKRVIDDNKAGQDQAWAAESKWIVKNMDALVGFSSETTIQDVAPKAA